jgi:hypothetical protein
VEKNCIAEDNILKLQELFEGCHNAEVAVANTRELSKARSRPRKMQRPRKVTHCNN